MIRSAQKEILSIPTPNAHASCVARVNGETWVVWFGGTREGMDDVDIYLTRHTRAGWTSPLRITAGEALPHWNPVLLPREDGALLYFKLGKTIPLWRTMVVHLDSQGRQTHAPRELLPGDEGGRGPVRNKCLTLADGRVLAPASLESESGRRWADCSVPLTAPVPEELDDSLCWRPFIDVSEDGGEHYLRIAPIPLPAADQSEPAQTVDTTGHGNAEPLIPCRAHRSGAIQPTLWQSADGHVHALMRSSEGCILRSDSEDGEHWTPAHRTGLPNNNSGIDLVQLADGRLLLCLNPVSGNWVARTPLWLYLSLDGGNNFTPLMALELNPGEYSYPSLAAEGNSIYLSYTWKREAIALWRIELENRA